MFSDLEPSLAANSLKFSSWHAKNLAIDSHLNIENRRSCTTNAAKSVGHK